VEAAFTVVVVLLVAVLPGLAPPTLLLRAVVAADRVPAPAPRG
jgi:hypothetical protein